MVRKTETNNLRFEDLASTGKQGWWRYLVALPTFVISAFVLSIPFVILLLILKLDWSQVITAVQNNDINKLDTIIASVYEIPDAGFAQNLVTLSSVSILIIPLWFITKYVHQRKFLTILTAKKYWDWSRVWTGFWAYGLIIAIITLTSYGITIALGEPANINIGNISLVKYGLFITLLIPLLFIQVLFEEAFFRGYLFQSGFRAIEWLQSKIPGHPNSYQVSIIISTIISVLLFGFGHMFNGPFTAGMYVAAGYFLIALVFQIIVIKDQRIELSVGAHLANNLLAFAILGSTLDGSGTTLLVDNTTGEAMNTPYAVLFSLAPLGLFYWAVFHLIPKLTKSQKNV